MTSRVQTSQRADANRVAEAQPTSEHAQQILGAYLIEDECRFRVWAPTAASVVVHLETRGEQLALTKDEYGYFNGVTASAHAGDLYRYSIDNKSPLPDPCSRYQSEGPHGASMIVDTHRFKWSDSEWRGIKLPGQVIYELHIGTFTSEGTFDAALTRLPHLKEVGITCIEVMPLAECPGRWNWGYDGVCMFAPSHCYGDYEAFKRFVDRAHALGIAVILDVVYNHLGPDGNYLAQFSAHYSSDRHTTEWGPPLNFDAEHNQPVRNFIIANACEWVREFHLDGLRLDATQSIHDDSKLHLLAEMSTQVRQAALPREIILVSENEPQHLSHLLGIEQGGYGLDAMWNDDFHHSAIVAATGRREAYYSDYSGVAQEFVSAAKRGMLFQGQFYQWQKQSRGQPLQTPLASCICFLENHDQVANSLYGRRLVQMTSTARYRALVSLLLLLPQTPMLFMGQEFNASSPFLFFTDHAEPLSKDIAKGRKEFLSQFPGSATPAAAARVADPGDENTFLRCKLDWDELPKHRNWTQLYTDLLKLRRTDAVISAQASNGIDGATLTTHAFVLRWFDAEHGDRLLIANFGAEVKVRAYPEPLLAYPVGRKWSLCWSSDDPAYDGLGIVNPLAEQGWQLPAESVVLFTSTRD